MRDFLLFHSLSASFLNRILAEWENGTIISRSMGNGEKIDGLGVFFEECKFYGKNKNKIRRK